MPAFDLKPGFVIRYDFLWKDDAAKGLIHGAKDRPCAVVLLTKPSSGGKRTVVVCPITHSPPKSPISAIAIPPKVARSLGLDAEQSWIRTHQVNSFEFRQGQIPFGVTPATSDRWIFGELPHALGKGMHRQVLEKSRQRQLRNVRRN